MSSSTTVCSAAWSSLMLLFFPQLNPDVNVFQRKFVNEVRRCEEMDRKLSECRYSVPELPWMEVDDVASHYYIIFSL